MNVQNKILIIGATSGIGSQISKELDNQYQLYLCGRNNDKLKIIKKILENKHTAIQLDICNNNDIDNLVAEISPVDGFVYCSGIAPAIPAKYIKETDIANVFDVNFIGAVKLVSELLKKKKLNSGASLVFISSEAVRQPYFGSALYSASKAALEAYSIALSKELGTKKIRVNCVSPTYVETPMLEQAANTMSEEFVIKMKKLHPEAFIHAGNVASVVSYLLSDKSVAINGQILKLGRFSINIPEL